MAAFAQSTFSHASYAASRPTYNQALYDTVLAYHHGRRALLLDLGCGTGIVTRALGPYFERAIGIDPSPGMIKQAQSHPDTPANVSYQPGDAETALASFDAASVDCVVAGQAAHWFDFTRLWPALNRAVRPGGTIAFWGYTDHVFVDYSWTAPILHHYAYDESKDRLGPYWSQPGRSYVQDKLRFIKPPAPWQDVTRIEYEPGTKGRRSGVGSLFLELQFTVGQAKNYIRTWSSFHGWSQEHPQALARSRGGVGDVVDELFDELAKQDSDFANDSQLINVEWGSGLVMARRSSD